MSVKHLLQKHEDLSNPLKSQTSWYMLIIPVLDGNSRICGVLWTVSLAELMSSRFSEIRWRMNTRC